MRAGVLAEARRPESAGAAATEAQDARRERAPARNVPAPARAPQSAKEKTAPAEAEAVMVFS